MPNPFSAWDDAAPAGSDLLSQGDNQIRGDKTLLAAILGTLTPFGTNTVGWRQVQIDDVIWLTRNAVYTGSVWNRDDVTKSALAIRFNADQTFSFMRAAAAANPITWVEFSIGSTIRSVVLVVPSDPDAAAMVSVQIPVPGAGTIVSIKSTCRVAAATTYTYDINKNGTTIYSTQANRPTRTSGNGTGLVTHTAPDVTALAADDILSVDLDTKGTGITDAVFVVNFLLT